MLLYNIYCLHNLRDFHIKKSSIVCCLKTLKRKKHKCVFYLKNIHYVYELFKSV